MKTVIATAPISAPVAAPNRVAPAPLTIGASLLEVMRALDGSKEDRFYVAKEALTSAYTLAMQYGNKSQLAAMVGSKGNKQCEKGMRLAIQTVGSKALHKNDQTRQQAIDDAVNSALALFASVACVVKAKTVKAVKETPPTPPVADTTGDDSTDNEAPAPATVAASIDQGVVLAYADTLDNSALAALVDALMSRIESRAAPMLKAA